ncbi:MAG: hypothetical protein KAT71_07705, partial [Gammaproteobacteria bacterium]|nr:hypothetical protein [Gammaproteobacteria bacterium]
SLIKDKLEQEYISCFLKVLSGFLSLFSEEQLKIIVGQFSNDEYVNLLDFLYLHKKQREAVVLYNNCPEKMLFNKAIALNILNSRYKDNPEVERFFVIDQGAFDNTAAAYIDSFQKQLASLSRLSEPDRAYYLQQLVHFFQNSSQFIPNICITKHQEIELVAKCALVFFATLEKLDGAPLSNFVKAAQEIYKAILQYSSRYTLHMYETLNKSWQIVQRKVANLPSLIQMACLNGILPDCYWNEFAKTIDDSFKIKILEESSKTIKAILMTIGKSEQAVTRTLLEQVYQDILLYLLLSYKSDLKSGLLNRGSIASLQQNILRLICHFYGFEAGEISAACCDTYNDLMQFLLEKIFQRLLQIDLTVFGFTSEEREKCDLFLEDFIRWHDCLVKIPAIDMMQSLRYREEVLLNDVGILIKYLTALDIKANLVAKNIIDALWQAIIILHRNITSEIDRFNVVEIGNMEEVLQRAKVLHMQKFGFIGRVVPLLLQAHFHKPQKISKIMFPCSFFEDLLSCYKAVCSHKHDLRTITKSERFFFELGRSGNYEEELFESADVIESVRAKIILELRLTSDSWGEEKRFEAGKVKWELYKNYLESLGIKDERFQSYIAAVLVQQNQKIMINDRSIIVNFSFSVSPLAWTALSELIWSVHSLTIMLKGGEKKPCVSYRYDSKEKNVAISYVDNLYLVDGDGGRHLCANVQYGITLYEDMQRLPDFYYRVIWKENVVVDGNNFSDLINVAFDPADIMMFPLQTRRLIVFNRILNDQDGAITLDLLGNQELRNSLMLTDKLFFSELIDLVTRKKGGAEEGKFAETLAILTSLKDLFAKRELRKASKQDSVSYLVTAARNSLLRLSTDSRLPRYWHYNLTQFASSNHPPKEKGKAQLKLAERMQNLQAAVTKLSDPRFQEKMSDADLVHILDTVGADIVSLYLCNCRKVTPEVLRVIKVKCPNIRWIYIVGLDWSNIVGVEFQHLHKLSLSHMPFLSQVRIAAASIKTVEVIDCPKLKILETTEIERAGLDVASSAAADFGYNIIKCPNLVTVLPKLPDRDPSSSVLRNSL